jgi:hypothetical protein
MVTVSMNAITEGNPADSRPGIYLIDVGTGQVTHFLSRRTPSHRPGPRLEYLSSDEVTQRQQKSNR